VITLDSIHQLDNNDELAHLRDEFLLPADTVYLDGNSLGALTKRAKDRLSKVTAHEWGDDLIHSWNSNQWINLPNIVGDKIASIIGAESGQVIACDSTSVNLFKVLASALSINSNRSVVLSQNDNFPTDLYMVQGLASLLGESKCQLKSVAPNDVEQSLDESVAVLMLTHVNFRSGEIHNMRKLTDLAHQKGILVIWDLAHSAGAVELAVDECNIDFAIGCGYKYLNGGPGAPAFIYAAKRHQSSLSQPLSGWMGHRSPFSFDHDYQAGEGMSQFLCGTPNILSMVALDAALEVFEQCTIAKLREKSLALSELFIGLVDQSEALKECRVESPRKRARRGSQVALSHDHAFAISQALIANKIIVDFREPNIIRFGFTPLYCRFEDVYRTVKVLGSIVENTLYENSEYHRRCTVT